MFDYCSAIDLPPYFRVVVSISSFRSFSNPEVMIDLGVLSVHVSRMHQVILTFCAIISLFRYPLWMLGNTPTAGLRNVMPGWSLCYPICLLKQCSITGDEFMLSTIRKVWHVVLSPLTMFGRQHR